ncbi:hypothetical protein BG000_011116, partial [Podila horticola]
SGGHSFEGYSAGGKDSSLMIDLRHFQQFSVDTISGVATIGAGTRLGPMYSKLWNAGQYLVPSGSYPTVGIGGIALGGGIGIVTRKYGAMTQNIVGLTLIDANGSIRKVSASLYPDLFWALRGAGGGSFGLVTEFQIQAYKAPPIVTLMQLSYPLSKYRDLIHTFGTWGKTITDDLYAELEIGRGNITVYGCFRGSKALARAAFAPFLGLVGEPQQFNVSELSWYQAATQAAGSNSGTLENPDFSRHRYHRGRSLLYRKPMSLLEMDTIYKYFHTIPAPKGSIETLATFEMWGGKINRPDSPPSAFDSHRGVIHSVQFAVSWNSPNTKPELGCPECMQWSTDFVQEMQAAYSSGP